MASGPYASDGYSVEAQMEDQAQRDEELRLDDALYALKTARNVLEDIDLRALECPFCGEMRRHSTFRRHVSTCKFAAALKDIRRVLVSV